MTAKQLAEQIDNYVNRVLKRGYPFKFKSLEEFNEFSTELKEGLAKIGVSIDDVRIQGSALRSKDAKDVDLAAIITDADFNKFLVNRFSNRITKNEVKINLAGKTEQELIDIANDYEANPAAYNNQCSSFSKAMLERKFSTYSNDKIIPDGKKLYKNMQANYPDLDIENISIQTPSSSFNLKPFMKL
ncbi:hypothetical protein [Flagellimonas sp.]|uniref:hypothetical protein n=1 Tax=Flagellimonas sp. TaxID=2058762 RepID=UPI003BACDFF8